MALGDVKEVDYSVVLDPNEKFDCVKAVGRKHPDPSMSAFWKGRDNFMSHFFKGKF